MDSSATQGAPARPRRTLVQMGLPNTRDEQHPQTAPRHDEILEAYQRLVRWYRSRSLDFHTIALILATVVCLAEVFVLFAAPQIVDAITGTTKSTIKGYEHYTPILWLIGVATGLIVAFISRYTKLGGIDKKADGIASKTEAVTLLPAVEYGVIALTVIALILETYGIATQHFTISALTRTLAIEHTWVYWAGGILTAAVAGPVVDLRRLPPLIRLVLLSWAAVGAHIFWWITPL